MFTIAGATGRVGSVVAGRLLDAGTDVTVLVRDNAKAADWVRRGAQVRTADLSDRAGLAAALRGSDGFFALLPFDPTSADIEGDQRRMIDGIAGAVADAAVPHVAMLSAVGADLPGDTGPIRWLHDLEQRLRATGSVLTAVRSAHFQEKLGDVLGAILGAGVYPVFRDSADVPIPMVASRDVAGVIADVLQAGPTANEVVDVLGPAYTERDVAAHVAAVLDRPVDVVIVPRPGWEGALAEAGLSPTAAALVAGLYEADQRDLLVPRGDRGVRGETPIEHTVRRLVATATEQPVAN
jgi:uncharacterized protein YbjT (DUF2867 family)